MYIRVSIINMKMQGRAREKRPYRKAARAAAETATHAAILDAAFQAFSADPFDRVTLNQIAERSGVTVQTVIRRFGSKEELFEELAQRESRRILAERDVAEGASLSAALESLLGHYERDGDTIARFVAQEHLFEPIRDIVERGRRIHREWVERHCRHLLSGLDGSARQRVLHAATVATDLSTWKLLRRDLGLESAQVAEVMTELLHGLERRS